MGRFSLFHKWAFLRRTIFLFYLIASKDLSVGLKNPDDRSIRLFGRLVDFASECDPPHLAIFFEQFVFGFDTRLKVLHIAILGQIILGD